MSPLFQQAIMIEAQIQEEQKFHQVFKELN